MKTLVIAPHPDDETFGVGGTIFRKIEEGAEVAWLIVTEGKEEDGWAADYLLSRRNEIEIVSQKYGFSRVFQCRLPSTKLDIIPMATLVNKLKEAILSFQPTEIFLPHPGDVHSDHNLVFRAGVSCSKWFRFPFIRRVFVYETLSETDFGVVQGEAFVPNSFVDISSFFSKKMDVTSVYKSELADFPFPRSVEALTALARLRGVAAGFSYAEAFSLLRQRV